MRMKVILFYISKKYTHVVFKNLLAVGLGTFPLFLAVPLTPLLKFKTLPNNSLKNKNSK